MLGEITRALFFTLTTMLLFGGAYPVALWGVGRAFFPAQANGSLVRRGSVVAGSRLIAQAFTRAGYFHPRPSGVDYDAASAGGTNAGPSNPAHLKTVKKRIDAVTAREGVDASRVPSEMVTASGGGLDPHIPPPAALLQAPRVASARAIPLDRVQRLIVVHTEHPTFGFLGRPRVNVLELNLALDEAFGAPPASR